jgi:hypothetical protein
MEQGIAALIADPQTRKRDERLNGQVKYKLKADLPHEKLAASKDIIKLYQSQCFKFNSDNTDTCPAGNMHIVRARRRHKGARQVTQFAPQVIDPNNPSERILQAIDSDTERQFNSQRIGIVEFVFGNVHHKKQLSRSNLGGTTKVTKQWNLYCMVHNIEKLAKSGLGCM